MLVNKSSDNQFIIPFVGLKIGKHEFEFDLTDAFFEESDYSIVKKGKVQVKLSFEKKETMMIGIFNISGTVETACDRCTEPVEVEVKGDYRLVYKFDSTASDDETLVIVYPEDFDVNVRDNILEFINVSVAARSVHKEGECNEDMLDLLDKYIVNSDFESDELDDEDEDEEDDDEDDFVEEEDSEELEESTDDENEDLGEIDPRWNALKNLKNDSPR
ncbi:MAG: hypothetical protein ACI837_000585 [Crocinitomicaceae bacterium]|jgi:uncharacterized protein